MPVAKQSPRVSKSGSRTCSNGPFRHSKSPKHLPDEILVRPWPLSPQPLLSSTTTMKPLRHQALSFSLLSAIFSSAHAFSFFYTSTPTQCGNVTVEWTGGQAPFTLLLVPVGQLNPETRKIIQEDVPSGNSVTFTLNYPANSQYVAVLNDATGIGSGGECLLYKV